MELTKGVHYLSGVGFGTIHDEWNDEDIDVDLFCIDGVTYGAYVDPDDGYRSYGHIGVSNLECQYTFEPQKVIVDIVEEREVDETWGGYIRDVRMVIIKDAILNKEVLRVGTDYADSYYPMAIFDYQPMNLYSNVARSIEEANN